MCPIHRAAMGGMYTARCRHVEIPNSASSPPNSKRIAASVKSPLHPVFVLSLTLLAPLLLAPPLHAQQQDSALSEAEVEQVRACRFVPNDCILTYLKFLDLRVQEVQDLYAHPRRPGREQDTHDLLEQFTAIADELADNLDDYAPRHADLRRALPKLVDAADRWASTLKSPPSDDAYDLSRKIALESIADLRASANDLLPQQNAWFKAHPPSKEPQQQAPEPITIPR
jgi:hypothetical protein